MFCRGAGENGCALVRMKTGGCMWECVKTSGCAGVRVSEVAREVRHGF